mgnify:CR=1 FL=1
MLLSIVAQALSSSYDSIVANWTNITFVYPTISGSNPAKTLTFTQGATRVLKFTFSCVGSLFYSKNGAESVHINSGDGLSVVTSDTLAFIFYRSAGNDETFVVTVRDETKNEVIDTFTVDYSGDIF